MTDFVGIGDLHLTNHLGKGGLSEYITDTDQMIVDLVQQPLSYASKNGIEHILLYGDIFDGPKPSSRGERALLQILKSDFKFHVILGNHDKFGEDSSAGHSLELMRDIDLPNVKIYEQPTKVKIGGARINFMPWPHSNFLPNCLNVAHVDVSGARSDSGRLLDGEKIAKCKYQAVIGHIHTRQQVKDAYYSGTLYQKNFGESLDKYFHHIQYDADGAFEVLDIPVRPIYKLHTIEVRSKEDLKQIPRSAYDFVKLILLEGATVSAVDYKHLNVVRTRPVGSQKDLELARLEDLVDGSEIKISSTEFFNEWLRNSNVDTNLKRQAWMLRKELISG